MCINVIVVRVSVNDIKLCVYFTFFMIVNLEFCESIQWFYFIVPQQKIIGKHPSFTFMYNKLVLTIMIPKNKNRVKSVFFFHVNITNFNFGPSKYFQQVLTLKCFSAWFSVHTSKWTLPITFLKEFYSDV